jgi:hypothetical protein
VKEFLHIETNKGITNFEIFRMGILRHRVSMKKIEMINSTTLSLKLIIRLKNGFNDYKEIEHLIFLN